ncbi:SDR family NAD(P)-dependent oxidoreductase [Saccharopolyspora sp. WRP15-2]|uniref:SDR family NAD(P)-dependent oxidoreductase n=1 Tax=Saccharopolyspora oryzae TaxID=2997343 RepID=A0ABT4V4C0_9PSEU|nr:SDR family NAD(P)-dependent oxidoreductase [Saccharopolyspora oryzae]MDA3628800.1 SDR family NAD(P)-dependent oxidoreductase [Saccharopolyspora oryzae]
MNPSTDYATEFAGRTALITGAASGIGLAVARRLAAGGATLAIADINDTGAQEIADELRTKGTKTIAIRVDVTDPASVEAAVQSAVDQHGALHLAVNNAGIIGAVTSTAEYPQDQWSRVISTNLDGVFYSLQYELPAILTAGGGAIVNLGSVCAVNGFPGVAGYAAAKHGVIGLTKTAALEYALSGVRINAIVPGFIDTPLLADVTDEERAYLIGLHPAGRLGTADEVAEMAAFLLSERASFVNGSSHFVDGAYSAR